MTISGVTWSGPEIDDPAILAKLPRDLAAVLSGKNGFILHHGALHVRGTCVAPAWHSLRRAWEGESAFGALYPDVLPTDVPFAQDLVGDQFLLRDGRVLRLSAETGELEPTQDSLRTFFEAIEQDIEGYLNLSLRWKIQPGELLFAFPPFFAKESAQGGSRLKACPAEEVIGIHADFARQIRDLPDGAKVEFRMK